MISIYVPRSLSVSRKALLTVVDREDVVDVRVSRGRVTDVVELDTADDVTPETEGEIRAAIAELLARGPLDEVADLNRRVRELEAAVTKLGGILP